MQLKRKQKTAVLRWIAEGLDSGEINELAQKFTQPFTVSRQQVDYYRKSRRLDLETIAHISEQAALTEGFASRKHRVYKLSLLAALMEKDLLGGLLWMDDVKGVGTGVVAKVVEFEEFNKAEVDAYRGVLDDIAREMGGRINKVEGLVTDDFSVWQKILSPRRDDGNFDQSGDAWGRQLEEGDETGSE